MLFPKLRYAHVLLVVFLSGCFLWTTTVHEIYSLKEAQATLDKADRNALVVFDVDDTLTYQIDVPFQRWFMIGTCEGKQFWKEVGDYIGTKENPQEYDKFIHAKRMLKFTDQPLEPITVSIIKKIQDRGIQVIALTHFNTGGAGKGIIPSLPKWRFDKLKEVGIDFSSSFPVQEIVFSHLTSKSGRHPVYYKGILLTDHFSKGEVLGVFFDHMKLKPSEVIMFDDGPDKIESVRNEMKRRGIPFQGFVYKARDLLPHVFDKDILKKQLGYIKEHDEFISDKEAKELLKK